MAATGTATVDFGAFPGSNEASVVITGKTEIVPTSFIDAFIMFEASTDHTENDHAYAELLMSVSCGTIVNAVGWTIYCRSEHKLQGTFKLRWVYTP